MNLQQSIERCKQQINESFINKDEILEDFLQTCFQVGNQDLEQIKTINNRSIMIKKHFQQQKCRVEHQFKYITTLLEQRKKELYQQIQQLESEVENSLKHMAREMQEVQKLALNIQQDIIENRNEIIELLDDCTFNQILNQFEEQLHLSQKYKKELLQTKIILSSIEEWSPQHQESIKLLINQSITLREIQKYMEQSDSSTCSDRFLSNRSSQEFNFKQQPLKNNLIFLNLRFKIVVNRIFQKNGLSNEYYLFQFKIF
ncbi:hypothetical protein pb186bvf_013919 [Paramecium bursaria]